MKKIIFIVSLIVFLTGCTSEDNASLTVEDYLISYQNLEYQVISDMEEVVNAESDLTEDQKEVYRNILKKQYEDLSFIIVGEECKEDSCTVEVDISVYDYYKAGIEASVYLKNNQSEFYDENNDYSSEEYMDYKLSLYQSTTNRVSHTVLFTLYNENSIWVLKSVDSDVLEKIHGIYNYNE